ncbi:hypothetical protein PRZ48_013882, partial [Zasmidium cellare]
MSSRYTTDAKHAGLRENRSNEQQHKIFDGLGKLTLDGHHRSSKPKPPRQDAVSQVDQQLPLSQRETAVKGHPIHIGPVDDPYSEAVANRNLARPQPKEKHPSHALRVDKSQEGERRAEDGYELGRTEDVETIVSQAPAVTHETRIVNTHEIVTKPITREIHNHHILHRVQPIDDVEVLPARHFAPHRSGEGLVEIPAPKSSQGIQERVRNAFLSHGEEKRASARKNIEPGRFEQGERHAEWTTPDGVQRSESVWIHDPQLATTARDAGETVPLHLDLHLTQ